MKIIEYSVPQRTAILYTPIGLMTSRNIFTMGNEHLLDDACSFCENIQSTFNALYGSEKAIIHCGNIGGHGRYMNDTFKKQGIGTTFHEQGRLKETIEQFLVNDSTFLLIVSAEYGMDFKDIPLQFILKVPIISHIIEV